MLGDRIKELRLKHDLTLEELAEQMNQYKKDHSLDKKTNFNKGRISKWENNLDEPRLSSLKVLADMFHISIDYFFKEDSDQDKIVSIYSELAFDRKKKLLSFAEKQLEYQNKEKILQLNNYKQVVKVYGAVSAGTGEYLGDVTPDEVEVDQAVPDHDFAVEVNGDSMLPLFKDKQIIFVKKVNDDSDIRNNQIVIAELNGDAYVKKLVLSDSGPKLVSLNPKYHDIEIHNYDDFIVRGIVVF